LLGEAKDRDLFELTRRLADRASKKNKNEEEKAWAFATLAELEIVGLYYVELTDTNEEQREIEKNDEREKAKNNVKTYCKEMLEMVSRETFHVESTIRQFRRYETFIETEETSPETEETSWKKEIEEVVQVALETLEGNS